MLFAHHYTFNDNISDWDVSNVLWFGRKFQNASQFNQDLSSWDMSSAKSIRKMFLDSPLVSNIDFSDDFKLKLRQSWEKLIDDQI